MRQFQVFRIVESPMVLGTLPDLDIERRASLLTSHPGFPGIPEFFAMVFELFRKAMIEYRKTMLFVEEPKRALAVMLLQELCDEEKGNFVMSPLSLGMTLTMLSAGLKGEAKEQIIFLFGGSFDEKPLHSMYTELLSIEDLPLKFANKYLYDQDCEINPEFEALLRVNIRSDSGPLSTAAFRRKIASRVTF